MCHKLFKALVKSLKAYATCKLFVTLSANFKGNGCWAKFLPIDLCEHFHAYYILSWIASQLHSTVVPKLDTT